MLFKYLSVFAILALSSFSIPASAETATQDDEAMARQNAVEENINYARRLENIVAPIVMRNSNQCEQPSKAYTGAHFMTDDSVGPSYRNAVVNLYNVGTRPTVTIIGQNSPAAKVLKVGDMITHVNGKALPQGRDSMDILDQVIQGQAAGPIAIQIDRAGASVKASLLPVKICDASILLSTKDGVRIFEDDGRLMVTKDMIDKFQGSTKLAEEIEEEYLDIVEDL